MRRTVVTVMTVVVIAIAIYTISQPPAHLPAFNCPIPPMTCDVTIQYRGPLFGG